MNILFITDSRGYAKKPILRLRSGESVILETISYISLLAREYKITHPKSIFVSYLSLLNIPLDEYDIIITQVGLHDFIMPKPKKILSEFIRMYFPTNLQQYIKLKKLCEDYYCFEGEYLDAIFERIKHYPIHPIEHYHYPQNYVFKHRDLKIPHVGNAFRERSALLAAKEKQYFSVIPINNAINWSGEYLYDDIHLTLAGHYLLAGILKKEIAKIVPCKTPILTGGDVVACEKTEIKEKVLSLVQEHISEMGLREIFKLLPKNNCRKCGLLSCITFAKKLIAGDFSVDKCHYLSEDSKKQINGIITLTKQIDFSSPIFKNGIFDSLSIIQLCLAIEQKIGFYITENEVNNLTSVRDLCEILERA